MDLERLPKFEKFFYLRKILIIFPVAYASTYVIFNKLNCYLNYSINRNFKINPLRFSPWLGKAPACIELNELGFSFGDSLISPSVPSSPAGVDYMLIIWVPLLVSYRSGVDQLRDPACHFDQSWLTLFPWHRASQWLSCWRLVLGYMDLSLLKAYWNVSKFR